MIRALALAAILPLAAGAETVREPEDYRMDHYRAPVPATLEGAVAVDSDAAYALWRSGAVGFVDVLPRPPKPEGLPEGTIWREKPRRSIPGAVWLPNVGYGAIAEVTDAYFREGLARVSAGDTDFPVVFFCLADCWMSWNAAKRALEYGYSRVFWFPEGTDGWEFEDYPTEVVEAEQGK